MVIGSDTLVPMLYPAGGCFAAHRRVFERLAKDLPLCNKDDLHYYPFFAKMIVEDPDNGTIDLSEDWAFGERARRAGFDIWLDPSVRLGHIGATVYTADNALPPVSRPVLAVTRTGTGFDFTVGVTKSAAATSAEMIAAHTAA